MPRWTHTLAVAAILALMALAGYVVVSRPGALPVSANAENRIPLLKKLVEQQEQQSAVAAAGYDAAKKSSSATLRAEWMIRSSRDGVGGSMRFCRHQSSEGVAGHGHPGTPGLTIRANKGRWSGMGAFTSFG